MRAMRDVRAPGARNEINISQGAKCRCSAPRFTSHSYGEGEVVPGAGVSGGTVEQDLAIIEVAMK
jgi:hypothetical protein